MSLQDRWKKKPANNVPNRKQFLAKWNEPNGHDYLKRTHGQLIVDKMYKVALEGKGIAAARMMDSILDRCFGKAAQALDINMTVMTAEQQLEQIEEALKILPVIPDEPNESSERIN